MDRGDPNEQRILLFANSNLQHGPPKQVQNRVHVSIAMFEDSHLTPDAIERLKGFDAHIAPSGWDQGHLAAHGIPSHLWLQGYDETIFRPAPKRKPAGGPLLVFSGGKLEFRKGQDITMAAFKRFRKTPEGHNAILVTAWQNKWIATMEGIWAKGYVKGVPSLRMGSLDVTSWAVANGLPSDAIIDLGVKSQASMADVIRECDLGLFPNRCEAATNMPIVETLALGVPCLATNATGHAENFRVLDAPTDGFRALAHNGHVPHGTHYQGTDGWFEADPDEIVEQLRSFVRQPWGPPPNPEPVLGWRASTVALDNLLSEIAG
jgi:glycosyltransferase involved in cell wall biosynthesis